MILEPAHHERARGPEGTEPRARFLPALVDGIDRPRRQALPVLERRRTAAGLPVPERTFGTNMCSVTLEPMPATPLYVWNVWLRIVGVGFTHDLTTREG
jgi:hypothetical protein